MTTAKATEGPYRVYEVTDDYGDGQIVARGINGADGIGLNKGTDIELFDKDDARLLAASWSLRKVLKKVKRAGANNPAHFKSDRDTALPYELLDEITAALALSEPETEKESNAKSN